MVHGEETLGRGDDPVRARDVLGADPRNDIRYGTLTFGYGGDLATLVQVSEKKRA